MPERRDTTYASRPAPGRSRGAASNACLRFRAAVVSIALFAAFLGIGIGCDRGDHHHDAGIRQADGANGNPGQIGDA